MLRKLALSLAVAGIVGTSNAHALGLGEIQIKSALNEPLQAEIQLLQMRDVDTSQIRPRMANIDEFALAGIEKLRFLSDVRFEVKPGPGGSGVITLISSSPVKEPFLNFLVEVNWPSGRLVREYTVLLDPPVYDPTPEPTAISPALSRPVAAPATVTAQPVESAAPVSNIRTRANPESQVYVDVNDTLWNIAKRSRPNASVTEAQMMLALQRKNPEAFEGNNVNRLKAGVVLDIPSLEEIQALTPKQANEEFWRQTQAWKQGRTATPAAPQIDGAMDKQAAPEKKDEEVVASQGRGQLKIVSPAKQDSENTESEVAGGTEAQAQANAELIARNQLLEAELAAALESVDQIQRENEELTGRVDALAQQMESLQRLLELKDQQLAELQAELEAAKAQPVPAPAPAPPKPGFMEQFGLYVYGGAAALVALLAGLLLMLRRKKKDAEPEIDEVAEEVAAVAEPEAPEEAESAEEVAAEETVEETADAVEDVVEEISDEDLDDLDLDLDMDLDEVDSAEDSTIDDDEFDLGLDDLEEDELTQPEVIDEEVVAEMAEDSAAEDVDDALDSILGEEPEAVIEAEEESVADDLDSLLAEVDGEIEKDELEFDLTAAEDSDASDEVVDDLDALLAEVDSNDEAELEFDLSESTESDEVAEDIADDLDSLLADSETADDAELEFDLSEMVSAEEDASETADAASAADETDLEFDLDEPVTEVVADDMSEVSVDEVDEADLDELAVDDLLELEADNSDEPVSEPAAEEDEALADLEALLDEADAESPEESAAVASDAQSEFADLEDLLNEGAGEEAEADSAADDLDSLLAEADAEVQPAQPDPAELSELHPELESMLDDLEGEDVVLEEQVLSSGAEDAADDLDVELDSELEALLSEAGDDEVALDAVEDDDAFDGLNLLEGADEVETKLDLARAYIDMEDIDGAKDILQEILKEGSDAQQQEANNLLGSLES